MPNSEGKLVQIFDTLCIEINVRLSGTSGLNPIAFFSIMHSYVDWTQTVEACGGLLDVHLSRFSKTFLNVASPVYGMLYFHKQANQIQLNVFCDFSEEDNFDVRMSNYSKSLI